MNDELKERERWNDPAANFLTVGQNTNIALDQYALTRVCDTLQRIRKRNQGLVRDFQSTMAPLRHQIDSVSLQGTGGTAWTE